MYEFHAGSSRAVQSRALRCAAVLAFAGSIMSNPAQAATKTYLQGLVAMGAIPESLLSVPGSIPVNDLKEPNVHQNVYVAVDVNITWAQLQPTDSSSLDTSAIESALAAITSYNAKSGISKKMTAKLRIYAGVNAPGWVLALDGGPVSLKASNGSYEPFPHYWSGDYDIAWQNLQTLLANVYDGDLRIQEVAVSSCSSLSAEPFIGAYNDATSRANLHTAGYSDAAGEACLNRAATTDYLPWTQTPIDFTFNTFALSDGTAAVITDPDFTLNVMASFRATYGTAHGVIANHGLQDPLNSGALPIYNGNDGYSGIKQSGAPVAFQAYSPSPAGGWKKTVSLGRSYGATEMEIFVTKAAGGAARISTSQLEGWAAESW